MLKTIALALASLFGFFGAGHPPATSVTHAVVVAPTPFPTCPPLPRAPFPYTAAAHSTSTKHASVLPPIHVCPL